jgi:hypothetical protein
MLKSKSSNMLIGHNLNRADYPAMSGWSILQILKVVLAEERVQAKEAKPRSTLVLLTWAYYHHRTTMAKRLPCTRVLWRTWQMLGWTAATSTATPSLDAGYIV